MVRVERDEVLWWKTIRIRTMTEINNINDYIEIIDMSDKVSDIIKRCSKDKPPDFITFLCHHIAHTENQ